MIVRRATNHIGDALMALAMMEQIHEETGETFVWQGTSSTNALMLGFDYIQTVDFEQATHWDLDLTGLNYAGWDEYAEAFGMNWHGKPASLKITDDEVKVSKLSDNGKLKIGLCTTSRDKHRCYPHHKALVKQLKKHGDVYIFGRESLPIRRLMAEISQLDKMVTGDTGMAHLAGCCDVPLVVIEGPTDCKELYDCYAGTKYVSADNDKCDRKPCINQPCKYVNCMYLIYPRKIANTLLDEVVELPQAGDSPLILETKYQDAIAFLRLDGLGGTITLSDHAKKAKEIYDYPVTLIVRGCEQLFDDNPNVDEVISVGLTEWHDCLEAFKDKFVALADIRFVLAKWYQAKRLFNQDFAKWEQMYEDFGLRFKGYNNLVNSSSLHHVQMTDKLLGLPYKSIDMEIFALSDDARNRLPDEYICVNSGVDVIHKGVTQTKCWNGWTQLVKQLDLPVVQIGTKSDVPIVGATDLRGKTDIKNLCGVIKGANVVICTEGGIMHLAYALHHPHTVVLRGPTRGKMFEYPGQYMVDSYLCEACVFTYPDWYLRCYADADSVCMKSITPERVYEAVVKN